MYKKTLLAAITILVALTFTLSFGQDKRRGPQSYRGQKAADTFADEGKGAGKASTPSCAKFYYGYCTEYAAAAYAARTGKCLTFGGDAWAWLSNAAKANFSTSRDKSGLPTNSILVFGKSKKSPIGHVCILEGYTEVDREPAVEITEKNYTGWDKFSRRKIKLSEFTALNYQGAILP